MEEEPCGLRVPGRIDNVLADAAVLDWKGRSDADELNAFQPSSRAMVCRGTAEAGPCSSRSSALRTLGFLPHAPELRTQH